MSYSKAILTNNTFRLRINTQNSFFFFIKKEKRNQVILFVALIAAIVQFYLFKLFYPFPDFFSDSYSYIYAAYANLNINIWPIGYSKFLRYFHFLSHSDTALVGFQYFLYTTASLYFLLTFLYFYKIKRNYIVIIFVFLFLNPLPLYLCNYINSDALFLSISLLWFTQILWIINHPRIYQIFLHAILLFACFSIRNNAYYYPFISILVFAISKQSIWRKVSGAAFGILLIIPFVIFTRSMAFKLTGTYQFSLFTGWQLANNALYMRDKIEIDSINLPDAECKELDMISKNFFKDIPPGTYRRYLSSYVGNYFIREPQSPLKKYFENHYNITDRLSLIISWGRASKVFEKYGIYLIEKEPIHFLRYFVPLNMRHYFIPPLEKLEIYNLGDDDVLIIAQDWFDYKTPEVYSVSKTIQGNILSVFPLLFLFTNLYLLGCLAVVHFKGRPLKIYHSFKGILLVNIFFLFANFCFTILATMNVLRYQIFPMIILIVSAILLSECVDRMSINQKSIDGNSNSIF